MKPSVVGLTDRGRGLEWLSLGFGLWLAGALASALLSVKIRERISWGAEEIIGLQRTLGLVAIGIQVMAVAAVSAGSVLLLRSGPRLWFGTALGALAIVLAERTVLLWLPLVHPETHLEFTRVLRTAWIAGSIAQLVLVAAVLLGLREIARAERGDVAGWIVGSAIGVELVRALAAASVQVGEGSATSPWLRIGFFAGVAVVGMGLVLVAIRAASAAVRAQIWAGQAGSTSPARAADWQRTATGLGLVGAFLIGKIAIAVAALPLAVMAVLVSHPTAFLTVGHQVVPIAGAVCSAGILAGLLACRRLPDPPDARAGFTGAALLVAACLVADVYLLVAGNAPQLAEAFSSLGHLVAYAALLRSIGRIGERLGDDDVTRRARLLGWFAIAAVGGGTVAGALAQYSEDLGVSIAGPMVVAGVAFAALLPCALLARQLATRLRRRFAEPPRARASFLHTSR